MPNCYSRLADLKAELQGSGSGTSNDAVLLRNIERVSRSFDAHCNRRFYSEIVTLVLDGRGARDLWLGRDLLSITSLKLDEDGDGVYETTLAAADYWTWPANSTNKRRLEIATGGDYAAFAAGVRNFQIVGMAGYSNEKVLAGTVAEEVDSSEAAITLTAGHDFSPGDTMVLDDEQIDVLAVASDIATVTRAINGTTAATHSNGASAYRRRFPRDLELATVMQAARFSREAQTGFAGNLGGGDVSFSFNHLFPAIRDLVAPYMIPGMG